MATITLYVLGVGTYCFSVNSSSAPARSKNAAAPWRGVGGTTSEFPTTDLNINSDIGLGGTTRCYLVK
jgi:hypothetical protein